MNESKKNSTQQWKKWYHSGALGIMSHARKRARALELASNQKVMDDAMVELETIDFASLSAVIGWFEKIRPVTDHIGVDSHSPEILVAFTTKGYTLDSSVDYNPEDEEIVARHMICQMLNYLQEYGGIHQIASHKMKEWRKKFHSTT